MLGKSRALCFSCVVSSAGCALFVFDMEKKTEKLNKARVIKGIVIGILLVFVLVCSSIAALNWELMDHAFVQAPDISSSETLNSTETVQESTQKNKDIKQKISKKKKKKSKKKTIESPVYTYVLNTNTGRFHTEDCYYVDTIAEHNKRITQSTREELIQIGYTPCQVCNP